jgi:SAM-dependent methyltransferase
MFDDRFNISRHNAHYEGEYSDRMKTWRRLAAKDKVNNLQALVGPSTVSTVLEVGCGTGAVVAEVARRGLGQRHVGIDMSDPSAHADTAESAVELIKYDGVRIPFEDGSFDLVFASHVVEHVPDPRGFLAEMTRVAAGLIYVEVPCELNLRSDCQALKASVDTGHINMYTPESFMLLLQTAGLRVQTLRIFDHSLEVLQFNSTPLKGLLHKAIRQSALSISPVLASRLFTFHCGAVCLPLKA